MFRASNFFIGSAILRAVAGFSSPGGANRSVPFDTSMPATRPETFANVPTDKIAFTPGSSQIGAGVRTMLCAQAERALNAPMLKLVIQGFATAGENILSARELAAERSEAIAAHLDTLGVPRNQMILLSSVVFRDSKQEQGLATRRGQIRLVDTQCTATRH